MDKVKVLGQVFTKQNEIDRMISLIENRDGRMLEPSCGDGAFFNHMKEQGFDIDGIELDPDVCPEDAVNMDFFDVVATYDVIIGNPPYVKGRSILPQTREKLDSKLIGAKGNLFLHFIERCINMLNDGGELIFINPLDFTTTTNAAKLNKWMLSQGTITHFYDVSGQSSLFRGANPDNCCIWRFVKGATSHKVITNSGDTNLHFNNGRIFLNNLDYSVPFTDVFYIKVGAVPGQKDKFFGGDTPFVYSKTRVNGETRDYNYVPEEWIRKKPSQDDRDAPRLYVNGKTLQQNPFFTHECKDWDGSVLAIFPRDPNADVEKLAEMLNTQVDWDAFGFVWHGKYVFTHGHLSSMLLPDCFIGQKNPTLEDLL